MQRLQRHRGGPARPCRWHRPTCRRCCGDIRSSRRGRSCHDRDVGRGRRGRLDGPVRPSSTCWLTPTSPILFMVGFYGLIRASEPNFVTGNVGCAGHHPGLHRLRQLPSTSEACCSSGWLASCSSSADRHQPRADDRRARLPGLGAAALFTDSGSPTAPVVTVGLPPSWPWSPRRACSRPRRSSPSGHGACATPGTARYRRPARSARSIPGTDRDGLCWRRGVERSRR